MGAVEAQIASQSPRSSSPARSSSISPYFRNIPTRACLRMKTRGWGRKVGREGGGREKVGRERGRDGGRLATRAGAGTPRSAQRTCPACRRRGRLPHAAPAAPRAHTHLQARTPLARTPSARPSNGYNRDMARIEEEARGTEQDVVRIVTHQGCAVGPASRSPSIRVHRSAPVPRSDSDLILRGP